MATTTRHTFELPRFEAPPVPSLRRPSAPVAPAPSVASALQQVRAPMTPMTSPEPVVPAPLPEPSPHAQPVPPPMHRELTVTSLPARPHRDGVLSLALGAAIAVALVALVMAMATGVAPEW